LASGLAGLGIVPIVEGLVLEGTIRRSARRCCPFLPVPLPLGRKRDAAQRPLRGGGETSGMIRVGRLVPGEGPMSKSLERFRKERERLNALVLERANLEVRRFFGLDAAVYRDGALSSATKEMLGLVASLVLRCDDCIAYHVIRCREEGVTEDAFQEVLAIGLVVGGSIVIPHVRRAVEAWSELEGEGERR